MTASFNSFRTPITRKTPSFTRACSSKALLAFTLIELIAGAACSGPNIHSDLTDDPHVLSRKWTLSTRPSNSFDSGDRGVEYSNPVIIENTLIFGNHSVGLVALYPAIDAQRWVLPIHGGVVSPLEVERDSVYFGGGDGFLYSVNIENGRVNWRYELRNPVISRPTVSGGRLFVTTSDDTVYAFDAATGKWLWHYRRRTSPSATIFGASQPLVDGNEVLTGLSDGFLVCLSLQDGQLKWERKLHFGSKFTDVDAHPVLDNGVIYIPSYDGALYALKRQGGDVIWRFDAGGNKTVILDGERLILPSSDGHIYALQKSNAKVLWKFDLDQGVPTRAVVTDKLVIVGSSFQYLYAIDKETGKGLYRFNSGWGSGFAGAPGFDPATNRVYFLSGSGNLYAFGVTQPPRKFRAHVMTDAFSFSPNASKVSN